MTKIDITHTELVWPGKYDDEGNLVPPHRVNLPFQIIERVNETRATREKHEEDLGGHVGALFDFWQFEEERQANSGDGWRNKLIWGDNLYVMGSLLEHFAGKIDLIYIDPPFATGTDFSFRASVGDEEIVKDQSLIEEKAYRDTWGRGLDSYLQMLWPRLMLMRDLLSTAGALYVHVGANISHYVKPLLDDVFGQGAYLNEVIWKRQTAHSDVAQGALHMGRLHDSILAYVNSDDHIWNMQYLPYDQEYIERNYKYTEEETGRKYSLGDLTAPGGAAKGNPRFEFLGHTRYWRFSEENMREMLGKGLIVQKSPTSVPRQKRYLDEMPGIPIQDLWTDINPIQSQSSERLGYDTQKPEALLERVIALSSTDSSIVADFFCGSGTTLAVAEKLNRRWIGCDLSRFSVHTTRKRMMDVPGCRPFEILNLGQYERQVWQGVTFGGERQPRQMLIFEYLKFILELYGAQPLTGTQHLHGKKGSAVVHVGAVDAPVTIDEVNGCLAECKAMKQKVCTCWAGSGRWAWQG